MGNNVPVLRRTAHRRVPARRAPSFASFAFVHPVIRQLEARHHIRVEQGLLRTFGRVMPVLMPLSAVVTVAYALADDGGGGEAALRWIAVGLVLLSVITTLAVNVPINAAT